MKPSAIELLREVAELGTTLQLKGDSVVCPQSHLLPPSLRRRIRERKTEVAMLLKEGAAEDACPESADLPTSETSETPLTEGFAGSAGSRPARSWDTDERPTRPCYSCDGRVFWALPGVGNWVCACCHPSDRSPEELLAHTVESDEERQARARTRSVGCPNCLGAGFLWYGSAAWTVCPHCNSGFYSDDVPPYGDARWEGGAS
jgi:hypothetical protein